MHMHSFGAVCFFWMEQFDDSAQDIWQLEEWQRVEYLLTQDRSILHLDLPC